MKVAFYLDSINPNIDYSDPEATNPGIGGTVVFNLFIELSFRSNW
ncbi:hypothetical protein ABG752_06590 [Streptococcus iniae]